MFDSSKLKVGKVYNNSDLTKMFKCAPQGGMRWSDTTKKLLLVSGHVNNIYSDQWVGNTLHYTGMGQTGDQKLSHQNSRLAESKENNEDIYLFEMFRRKEYTYQGRVYLSKKRKPYKSKQPDKDGKIRSVWIFPIELRGGKKPIIDEEQLKLISKSRHRTAKRLSLKELKKRAKYAPKKPRKRTTKVTNYDRDPYVTEYAKRRAKGKCELCGNKAPFKSKDGEDYLETHHIIWLAKNGLDSIGNTAALCPNCHKKMHILNLRADKAILKRIASK